jgi:hypothetical protein
VKYRGGAGARNWAYDFAATTARADGGRPRSPARVEIRYPRGIRFNGLLFRACPEARRARCPPATRVGKGTATFDGRPDAAAAVPATVDVFNGGRTAGKPSLVYVFHPEGYNIGLTFTGVFVRNEPSGPFGHVKVIDISGFGPNPPLTLTALNLRMTARLSPARNRRRMRPLFEMTAPCTEPWTTEWRNVYPDGSSLAATATTPCP